MKHATAILLAATVCAASAAAQEPSKPPQLAVFATQARVEVGASGKVLSVTPDPKLPPLVGDAIVSTVAAWTFVPPRRDGQPVGGVTHVHLVACAAPAGDGFRLAIDYRSHGPGRVGPPSPEYPRELIRQRVSTKVQLDYRVQADGSAAVEQVDVEKGNARARGAARASMLQWVGANVFQPELVDGQPVSTRVSLPIEFIAIKKTLSSRAGAMREAQAQVQAFNAVSPTCQAALAVAAKRDRSIVLDSPFKRLAPGS